MDPNAARQLHSAMAKYHSAMATNPEMVDCFLDDIPTTEPVEDYVTDLDERCSIFEELQQLHRQRPMNMPTAATLGVFLVAPISNVRQYLEIFRGAPAHLMFGTDGLAQHAIHCMLRPRPCPNFSNIIPHIICC